MNALSNLPPGVSSYDIEEAAGAFDDDSCHVCKRSEGQFPYGLMVRECTNCERLICDEHSEADYDMQGDPGHYVLTSWTCAGTAREECERIAAELGSLV